MTETHALRGPTWLRAADERPHAPDNVPLWCENYLSYMYDPRSEVGAWFHISHRPGRSGVWQETMLVALPHDEFLAAKAVAPGRPGDGVSISGLAYTFDTPFGAWTLRYRGGARLVGGDELRAGPLSDGPHVPVELELCGRPLSPPFDFGKPRLDQEWGTGHYELHQEVSGTIAFAGRTLDLAGTGLRDHSWGPRDYGLIGTTTWIHGQFPSGRGVMAVRVTGVPPAPVFAHGVVSDADGTSEAQISGIPAATELAHTGESYVLRVEGCGTVEAEILRTMPLALLGPAEIGIGTHGPPAANHHYVQGLTRFSWDGEVGYGITERSIDLTA